MRQPAGAGNLAGGRTERAVSLVEEIRLEGATHSVEDLFELDVVPEVTKSPHQPGRFLERESAVGRRSGHHRHRNLQAAIVALRGPGHHRDLVTHGIEGAHQSPHMRGGAFCSINRDTEIRTDVANLHERDSLKHCSICVMVFSMSNMAATEGRV